MIAHEWLLRRRERGDVDAARAGAHAVDYRTNARVEADDARLLAEARIEGARVGRRSWLWLYERSLLARGEEMRGALRACVPLLMLLTLSSMGADPALRGLGEIYVCLLLVAFVPAVGMPFLGVGRWLTERGLPEAPPRRIAFSWLTVFSALPATWTLARFVGSTGSFTALLLATCAWSLLGTCAAMRGEWTRDSTPPF